MAQHISGMKVPTANDRKGDRDMKKFMQKAMAILLVVVLLSADVAACAAVLQLPASLKTIEEEAFKGTSAVEDVVIPEGATGIGDRAFADSGVQRVFMPQSMKTIADDAFDGSELKTVVASADSYAGDWAEEQENVELVDPSEFAPTVSGFSLNCFTEQLFVREGDVLTFFGEINAAPGTTLSSVQVSVFDAASAYAIGETYYFSEKINATKYDLLNLPRLTVGEPFGASQYTMKAGQSYIVMLRTADSNGNGFADSDSAVAGSQGPCILVNVVEKAVNWQTGTPAIELAEAKLNYRDYTPTYFPGGVINFSGIKVKNTHVLLFTSNNASIPDTYVSIPYSGSFVTINDLKMTLPRDVMNGDFYFEVYAFNLITLNYDMDYDYKDRLWYSVRFGKEGLPEMDMSSARLSKSIYKPGETLLLTGIKYKFSNYLDFHFSKQIGWGVAVSADTVKSDRYQEYNFDYDIPTNQEAGYYSITVTAYDYRHASEDGWQDLTTWPKSESYVFYFTVAGEGESAVGPTVENYTLNNTPAEITVPEGSTLSLGGTVLAGSAKLQAVQVSILNAYNQDVGVAYDHRDDLNADTFDLSTFDPIVVGQTYKDANQEHTMTAGNDYLIMLYASDANSNGFGDLDPNVPGPQGPSILVHVVEGEPTASEVWKTSYDACYTTIKLTAEEGKTNPEKGYLFIAENANGGHHSALIAAGETKASFRIKDLQMKRAAKYSLFVLPDDMTLTDENRSQYFIKDMVLPLYTGNMITAVRSGDSNVTSEEKLYIGKTVEIDWQGSYGVYNAEVLVTVNGQVISEDFPEICDDPTLIDRDNPVTTKIDGSLLANVKDGDVLKITVTVTPPEIETQTLLTDAKHRATVSSSWEGTFVESHPVYYKFNGIGTKQPAENGIIEADISQVDNIQIYAGDHHPSDNDGNNPYYFKILNENVLSLDNDNPHCYKINVVDLGFCVVEIWNADTNNRVCSVLVVVTGTSKLYVFGHQLEYPETSRLYNEQTPFTKEAQAVWNLSSTSLRLKQIWFELNVGEYMPLHTFEFESYNDEWWNHQIEKYIRSGAIFADGVIGNIWDLFINSIDNAAEGVAWIITTILDDENLAKSDKDSMAEVMVQGWIDEINAGMIEVPDRYKLEELTKAEEKLLLAETVDDVNSALKLLNDTLKLLKVIKDIPVVGNLLSVVDRIENVETDDILRDIERYKAEVIKSVLNDTALTAGLDEDMKEAVDKYLARTSNIFFESLAQSGTFGSEFIGLLLDVIEMPGAAIQYGISMGIRAEAGNVDDLELINEYGHTLEGALKVYLAKTKPQAVKAINDFAITPSRENYLKIRNLDRSGKLDIWYIQSKQLSKMYWMIKGLTEGDKDKYSNKIEADIAILNETYRDITHLEWKPVQ